MKRIFFAILGINVLLAIFLIGRQSADRTARYDANAELALAGNSLVDRFHPAKEKRLPPSGPVKLSNDPGEWLQIAPAGRELLYYLPRSGEIRAVALDLAGGVLPVPRLAATLKPNLKSIVWPPAATTLLAEDNAGWTYYALPAGTKRPLETGARRPAFSPDGKKAAYLRFDNNAGTGEIRITDLASGLAKAVLKTRSAGWEITWLDGANLGLVLNSEKLKLELATGNLEKADFTIPKNELVFQLAGKSYRVYLDSADHKLYAAPSPAAGADAR